MAIIDRRLAKDAGRTPSFGDYVIDLRGDVHLDYVTIGSIIDGYLVPKNGIAKLFLDAKIEKENNHGCIIKTSLGYKVISEYTSGGLLDLIKEQNFDIRIDDSSLKRIQEKSGIIPIDYSFVPKFRPWFDVYCPNPLKKFPEDDEIHINIKKRDIKFNFKN